NWKYRKAVAQAPELSYTPNVLPRRSHWAEPAACRALTQQIQIYRVDPRAQRNARDRAARRRPVVLRERNLLGSDRRRADDDIRLREGDAAREFSVLVRRE